MAGPQIFELERGRTFVAGLFWQPLQGTTKERRKAAQGVAKEQSYDLVVWREGTFAQAGMGSSNEGLKAGMYSAAAIISKTVALETESDQFLVATEVPGGKWLFVSQRDGFISPDGDFIGEEDEVRSKVLDEMSASDWAHVYAPEHWNIANAVERPFESFLPGTKSKKEYRKWWALTPIFISPTRKFAPLVIAAGVILVLIYGYKTYEHHELEVAIAKARRMQQLAAEREAELARHKPPPHPWKSKPNPELFAERCIGALAKVKGLWAGGWDVSGVSCGGHVLTVSWRRAPGGLVYALTALEPRVTFTPSGSRASLVVPLIVPNGPNLALPPRGARLLALDAAAEKIGIPLHVAVEATHRNVLPGSRRPRITLPWKRYTWEVQDTTLTPSDVVAVLDGPAFRVSRILGTFKAGVIDWTLEGQQYVQRP